MNKIYWLLFLFTINISKAQISDWKWEMKNSPNSAFVEGDTLWLACQSGLVGYNLNNSTVTRYDHLNSQMPPGRIQNIVGDIHGNKWMVHQYNSLIRYNAGNFVVYPDTFSLNNYNFGIINIVTDSSGNLWCRCYRRILKFDGSTWTQYDSTNTNFFNNINNVAYNLHALRNGNILVCLSDGSYYRFDGTSWSLFNLPVSNFNHISESPNGELWMSKTGGLYKWDGNNVTHFDENNSPIKVPVIDQVVIDNSSIVWIISSSMYGANCGPCEAVVQKFDGTNWTTFNMSDTPFYDINLTFIFYDQQHGIFAGGESGRVKNIDNGSSIDLNLNPYGIPGGYKIALQNDEVLYSIEERHIFGTWMYYLKRKTGSNWETVLSDSNKINGFTVLPSGVIYYRTNIKLIKWDNGIKTSIPLPYPLVWQAPNSEYDQIEVDCHGQIWIDCLGYIKLDTLLNPYFLEGISFLDTLGNWNTTTDSVYGLRITDIFTDTYCRTWAVGNKLSMFDGNGWIDFPSYPLMSVIDGRPDSSIHAVNNHCTIYISDGTSSQHFEHPSFDSLSSTLTYAACDIDNSTWVLNPTRIYHFENNSWTDSIMLKYFTQPVWQRQMLIDKFGNKIMIGDNKAVTYYRAGGVTIDVPQIKSRNEIVVYPSVSESLIRIGNISPFKKIIISDIIGRTIYEIKIRKQEELTINISDFKSGIYLVSAYGDNSISTLKFIRQ